ncbi:hypothetical protein H1230_21195 [Paenibacillus sp. 19GGS1-52]|uniref:hypothetical protein n=1 Tax=Paenibacillus sp. 19GGS1-52 TaxID=2758563 RepID=UPI001EFBCC57|nr:hypothetical protein [Paenibacillus sp. 19GGS1-52]ULO05578.1 hypothetical protein H1230_21195 [Paenibacillus sp. 19GGS1-52]
MINDLRKNRSTRMIHKARYWRGFVEIVILLTLLTANVTQASAASDWDNALDDINAIHGEYTALQGVIKADRLKIQKLRKENNDDLKTVNAQLLAVDQALLSRLKTETEAIRKKYAPLLEQYSTLSKQSTAAKKAGDTKTATLLDLKRNKLKAAVTAARAEVKNKVDALAAARKATAAKTKPAKDAIAPVAAIRKQIVAGNKSLAAEQKLRLEADTRYKSAVKQGNAITAAVELKLSYAHMSKIHTMQQMLYSSEQSIALAVRTAESKLPK